MPLFPNLLDFIQHRMRMSHIYQPVMLTTLLRNDGAASVRQIAQQFAQRDEALIEYYAKITKEMPGRVPGKNHGIVTAVRGERSDIIAYRLNDNAMKGNKDDANSRGDFRGMHHLHEVRETGCLFCTLSADQPMVREAELAYVIRDRYPVTAGHPLIGNRP